MTMTLTVLCKRITGLLILIFIVSVFSLVPVQAATKKECKNYLTNAKYVTRYNVSIDEAENGKNKYVIKFFSQNEKSFSYKNNLKSEKSGNDKNNDDSDDDFDSGIMNIDDEKKKKIVIIIKNVIKKFLKIKL